MRAALLLLLLAGLATPARSAPIGKEARCTELGADCACSDPMDDVAVTVPNNAYYSFPASTLKCNSNGQLIFTYQRPQNKSAATVAASTTKMPGTLGYVLRLETEEHGITRDDVRTITKKTFCNRTYFKVERGYPIMNIAGGERFKVGVRYERTSNDPPGTNLDVLNIEASLDDDRWLFDMSPGNGNFNGVPGSKLVPESAEIGLNECGRTTDSWCYVETCFDHNSDGTNHMDYRARVHQVSTGRTVNYTPKRSNGTSLTAQTGAYSRWPFGIYNISPAGHYFYYSSLMEVVKNVDPTFWIGPSIEIEGGVPVPAPSAPVLLQ